jgi:tetratricopeptide (TPR) repeat protein
LQWLDAAFAGDPQDVRAWPVLEPLAPHALTVVHYADGQGIADPTSRLMNQLGLMYLTKVLYREAEPLMRRALAINEFSFGAEHPTVASCLNNLAGLLQATNRLAEAEPLMRRALAINEVSFGAEHPDIAVNLHNLAQLLKATNRLTEAKPLMRRALAINETCFGAEHPTVAICLRNLAQLLKATNRLAEAEPLMRRSLAIVIHSYGVEHPIFQTALQNYKVLGQSLGWPENQILEAVKSQLALT